MMARKSKIDEDCEELSVVAAPWNLKLKPAVPLDKRFTYHDFTHFGSRLFWVKMLAFQVGQKIGGLVDQVE